jgi:rSAM/selenodomain-associated transferase 2/rSAM/selenodomain-associated transferase 1
MSRLRIVIPVLNEGLPLAEALAVLQPLRARGVEVVVVDGGSDDETWLIARRFADQVLVAPRGRGAQMNAGARAGARPGAADVLLFVHADTMLPPNADALIARAIAGGATWGRFDVRIDGAHPMLSLVGKMMNVRSRWTGIATGDQAMFVRHDTFERAGGFADIPLMEDIRLSARLRRSGRPACLTSPVVTSARRWEQHGIIRTILLMWRLRLRHFLGADPQALADGYGYSRRPPVAKAAVAIMAKAPVPGFAKTRLAAGIGFAAAARMQRGFILCAVETTLASGLGPVRLWCAPDAGHRFFRMLARHRPVETLAQCGGDLGHRMQAAMAQHFAVQPECPLLIIGTDCPVLAPGHLHACALALLQHDAAIIPAADGGYVMIGLRKPIPEVFAGIEWSSARVMAQTRERLKSASVRWCELAPLWDVDDPADYQRYLQLPSPQARPLSRELL